MVEASRVDEEMRIADEMGGEQDARMSDDDIEMADAGETSDREVQVRDGTDGSGVAKTKHAFTPSGATSKTLRGGRGEGVKKVREAPRRQPWRNICLAPLSRVRQVCEQVRSR